MAHHLIFEGAELAGKSWIMSQIYEYLEAKYGQNKNILDGCHWFNADVGVYGTEFGKAVIKNYLRIFQILAPKNILVEKLHIADIVYNQMYNNKQINYQTIEQKLQALDFKIVFIKFKAEEALLQKRIKGRLDLYPHYKKILKTPAWYIAQQTEYEKTLKKSLLPVLTVETEIMPDKKYTAKILRWLGE